MSKDFLDYESLVQAALREVVHKTLSFVAKNGLSGNHHFYITFDTTHPLVKVPEYLKEQYGEEITIVLQYEFWDLEVTTKGFSVNLCFDENNEHVYVPFSSITSFVDPSVKFGLQFTPVFDDVVEEKVKKVEIKAKKISASTKNKKEDSSSNVITLDIFRKK